MIREVDFHQVADKPNKEPAAAETKTNGTVPAGMSINILYISLTLIIVARFQF